MAADIPLAIDHFRHFAGCIRAQEGSITTIDADTHAYYFHEPLGVVGQIIPWNFPILMAVWKLAPALAAGNCVVLKPAEQTPVSIMVLIELIADLAGGCYVKPTVFAGKNRMRIFQEEIFGTMVSVTTFRDEEEALEIANDMLYGLGAGLWTRDGSRAFRIGREIQAGRVWTNCYHLYPAHAAFGGYKQSGIGRENPQFEYWQHTQLIIDVAAGMFSLDNGSGKRYLTRSRLYSDEEAARLETKRSLGDIIRDQCRRKA